MGPGGLLELIRRAGPITRADLIAATGLGRSTVSQRLDALIGEKLVLAQGEAPSTGGRRPATLVFNDQAGIVLAADLGATHSRLAVADLSCQLIAETTGQIAIGEGPETVLAWAEEQFAVLLAEAGREPSELRAIGIGVPGPVEFDSGRPVNPPIMAGWDGFDVPGRLGERYPVPVLVDNDVNVMSLGEHHTEWSTTDNLLFVKVGTGIGCGIIVDGEIYRGTDGAAGDIGHIQVAGHEILCECGNVGCLEIVAGGRALARDAREAGRAAESSSDIVELVRAHDVEVVRLVRQAGRHLGEVLAGLVNLLNPSMIIIGGDIARAHGELFAGVREVIYQRSTPLATKHLQIVRSTLDDRAGVIGASVLATQHVLSPELVDRQLLGDGANASAA